MSTPRELRDRVEAELAKLPSTDRQAHGFRSEAPEPAPTPDPPAPPPAPASPTGLVPNPAQGGGGAPIPTRYPTTADAIRARAAQHFN